MNFNIVLKANKSPDNLTLGDIIELLKSLVNNGYDIQKMMDFKIEFESTNITNTDVKSLIQDINMIENKGSIISEEVSPDNENIFEGLNFE